MAEARPEIPDKLYFKIGEVAKIVGVKPYVLRYWETEFAIIRPGKTRSNHRLYRRRDVETLLEIKRLLHNERYTIEGAKRRLRGLRDEDEEPAEQSAAPEAQMNLPLGSERYRKVLAQIRAELLQLREILDRR